jgi:HAD superfamily 5'-nucleotidase-like hydrolase
MKKSNEWIHRLRNILNTIPQQNTNINRAHLVDRFKNKLEAVSSNPSSTAKNSHEESDVLQRQRTVYANNYVNLQNIQVIGFDLDYTLVNYTNEVQRLIYESAQEILIHSYGFPAQLKDCKYDPNFAIRGLSVDMSNGILCKLSHLQRVALHATYHGKHPISVEAMEKLYGESRHVPYNSLQRMRPLYDLFSIVEASLISDLIDYFEHRKRFHGESYDPAAVMEDIEAAVRDVHISGNMHSTIVQDLDKYVLPSPKLPELFTHLHNVGQKKLFLCTNSPYKYASRIMRHLMGIPAHDLQGSHLWRECFDVIICSASKPMFYNTKTSFRQWNIDSCLPSSTPVKSLEKGSVYIHGSCYALHKLTGWKGREVLYIGDNLRADLREARRWHGWHTGCVIHELTHEIDIQYSDEFMALYAYRSLIREFIHDYQQVLSQEHHQASDTIKTVKDHVYDDSLISSIEAILQDVNWMMSSLFNERFGSIFRTDGHPSLFAFAIKRYCDLYMNDVTNLIEYSPSHRFYPRHGIHMVKHKLKIIINRLLMTTNCLLP